MTIILKKHFLFKKVTFVDPKISTDISFEGQLPPTQAPDSDADRTTITNVKQSRKALTTTSEYCP